MRYVFIICFLIGGTTVLKAQDNFISGYYVEQEGDTVKGLIEDRSDRGNFNSCNFKLSADAKVTTFSTEDILAFGFYGGVAYQEFIFKEKSGSILDGFFKILVKGKLTLVNYDVRYFAVTDKNEIYEVTRTTSEASGKLKETFQGLGHLKLLMSDCPKTNEEWLLKKYSDKNLKEIFLEYNQCVGSSAETFEEPKSQTKFNYGVQILPSIVAMKAAYPIDGINTNNTLAGGFFVSVRNPRKWLGITIMLEGNYYRYSGYDFFRIITKNINNDVFVKYNAIQIPLYFRLGQKYFLDFGLQNVLLLNQESRWRVETETTVVRTSEMMLNRMDGFSLGWLVGGGMKFDIGSHPLRVFARYSQTGNSYSERHIATSVGVSFQFTKN